MKPFWVYMLRCADGSYYVGHTDDLELRLAQHGAGSMGGYTARRRPVTLVWSMETTTREEALERELQVKAWSRAKKEALVRSDWSALKRAARGPDRQPIAGASGGEVGRPSTPAGSAGLRSGRTDRSTSGGPANADLPTSCAEPSADLSTAGGEPSADLSTAGGEPSADLPTAGGEPPSDLSTSEGPHTADLLRARVDAPRSPR